MFRAEATWVGLVLGLAAVAGQTYLGRYRIMAKREWGDWELALRTELWANHDFYAGHILSNHSHPWDSCPVAAQIRAVGWDVDAYIVASTFDCKELLND